MAHIRSQVQQLMRIRQIVLDEMRSQPDYAFKSTGKQFVVAEEEHVVSNYVLAIVMSDVKDAIDTLGPT